jgi:tetratricopeptide (TPR) repeat protein
MLKGNSAVAIGYFKKALELEPNFAKAHNNLGLLLMARNDYAAAAGHFEQALRTDPDLASARQNLQKAVSKLN